MKQLLINIFLWYLRTAAKIQLIKIKPEIIALTGSVGKTSLRNAIYAVLKDNFKCKKSAKANSETGIPLDLLGLHPKDYSLIDWLKLSLLVPWKLLTNWQKYAYYIVELGVDDPYPPKNMEYLLRFIHPDIAIFLNVALVHSLQFGKLTTKEVDFKTEKEKQEFLLKAIAKEKGRIITSLSEDKTAIVNSDDPLVMEQAEKSKAKKFYFGKKLRDQQEDAPGIDKFLKIGDYEVNLDGCKFEFEYLKNNYILKLPYLLPEYYGYTFAAAILTAISLKIPIDLATNNLATNFKSPPSRMSVFKGIKDTIIIDSSYNASKTATLGALDLLKKINISSNNKKRSKVFVFGDMRELGEEAKVEHIEVAGKISEVCNRVVLIGPLTKEYVLPVVSGKIKYKWFTNSWEASSWLKENLYSGELILIKGSQNTIFTEIVVEALLADKKDIKKLCRRGKFWDRQRLAIKNL
ncbi:hypothetical protein A3J78_01760 [Candidatus Beckwithbacteria bacterium RBG_13_35_6]|uniref:Mur ligase central domain-containing protein n=1 Tax=Candidatus Beckwithbacteria bacterium RBG_13_35_6 TaxID=1797456 RepID=A0A1F5DHH8_9BACT|nr:MAG: hypothetical protein A3J78_01760 [Candidatus Beckwithbacteria bacterium RBG_13_35_6]